MYMLLDYLRFLVEGDDNESTVTDRQFCECMCMCMWTESPY